MNLKRTFLPFKKNRREKQLLDDINARLPRKINWKQGAIDYLEAIIQADGGHNRRFELVKPFQGGPDYSSFFTDLFTFLDLLEKLNLPPGTRILDVGCGAGWVSHYLAKLGYRITGVDISAALIDIARERIAGDPFPPYVDRPFAVDFLEVDVEEKPLPGDMEFDCVLYMSALHHFLNPLAAIRNTTCRLKDDGLLAIVEAAAPEPDSSYDLENRKIMEKYHTLERPYTRDQLHEILQICGFEHSRFYQPLNGLFLPGQDDLRKINSIVMAENWNIAIAARHPELLPDRYSGDHMIHSSGIIEFGRGFYDSEDEPDRGPFRWSGPESYLETRRIDTLSLELEAVFLDPEKQSMKVFVARNDSVEKHLVLTRQNMTASVSLDLPGSHNRLCFMADYVFRPDWFDLPDNRLLSFKLRIL
ncbi:MAG TPA: class I SAM-dependent methyltransferase [bacterium]|nr:class I SAM-dependent methyltransferase [bacterium]